METEQLEFEMPENINSMKVLAEGGAGQQKQQLSVIDHDLSRHSASYFRTFLLV